MNTTAYKSLEHLFISKVRIKTLKYFVLNPNAIIHLRGAVREFEEEINAVRRELNRLEETKFIICENKGNRRYFKANVEHPFFNDISSMFHKVFGLGGDIITSEKKIGEVNFAFLTPVFTKGVESAGQQIDFVVIGDVDLESLESIIKKHQTTIGRELHYMVFKQNEFALRKRRKDQMIIDLLNQDNTILIGNYEELVK
jgi:DNA-binding transcriptional ArsR family regulator